MFSGSLYVQGVQAVAKPRPVTAGSRISVEKEAYPDEGGSEAATFVVADRGERQTRVKLESLERRLRANEKARKELEEEAEKWKEIAEKSSKDIPAMTDELASVKSELQARIDELGKVKIEHQNLTEMRSAIEHDLAQAQEQLKTFQASLAAALTDNEDDLHELMSNQDEMLKLVSEKVLRLREAEEQLGNLNYHSHERIEKLRKTTDTIEKMRLEIASLRKAAGERMSEEEIELAQEEGAELRKSLERAEAEAKQAKLDCEAARAEARATLGRVRELQLRQHELLVEQRAADAERRALFETTGALLGVADCSAPEAVKSALRSALTELHQLRDVAAKAEQGRRERDDERLTQAKTLRAALFRARTAEEEATNLTEKINALASELYASEMERKDVEQRLQKHENSVKTMAAALGLGSGNLLDDVTAKVLELVQTERKCAQILVDERVEMELRNLRSDRFAEVAAQLQNLKKRVRLMGVREAKTTLHKLDHTTLAQLALEAVKNTEEEAMAYKGKLSEQERKIRKLEAEKREKEKRMSKSYHK